MLFKTERFGQWAVIIFQTPNLMNGMDIERIEKSLTSLIDDDVRGLLLDFRKVEYISSQALSLLLRLHTKLAELPGGKLAMCRVNPKLLEALRITRLHRILQIFQTRTEAVSALKIE